MENVVAWLENASQGQLIGVVFAVFVFSYIVISNISKRRKNKTVPHRSDEGAHYHSDKWSKNPKHLDSDYKNKYRVPKLYNKHLQNHKLEPLPDSLFRKNNEKRRDTKIHNDDVSLAFEILNGKTAVLDNHKVCCPCCDGFIAKRRNFITNMYFYFCSNSPDCNFQTSDVTNIKPLKITDASYENADKTLSF